MYSNISNIEDDFGLIKYGRPKTVYKDYFVNLIYTEGIDSLSEKSVLKPYKKNTATNVNSIHVLYKYM